MPRKSKNSDVKSTIDKKKGLMNTIVKDVVLVENEDIILQLPISANDITKININKDIHTNKISIQISKILYNIILSIDKNYKFKNEIAVLWIINK